MDVLKDLFDNLNDSVIIINGHGQIVLYNNEALRVQKSISGRPIEIGLYFRDLVSEERRKTVIGIIKRVKRHKRPVKDFAEYKTRFGTSVYLEVNFVPVLGLRKEVRYVNIIAQDITARKIFERNIRTVTSDVSKVLEHAHAIIFSVDTGGYIVEWNNHCAAVTGYDKREILSQKFSEVLGGEANSQRFKDLISAVLHNKPVGSHELPLRTKAGGEITVMLSATPRTNAKGEVIGATLVGQDITELTAYRRSLEKLVECKTVALEQVLKKEQEAVELKSRFVSIASHEFRSPLSSIDFAARFLKQNAGTIGKKKLNEKVKVIERHVHHMSHLLEDVLTLSKSDNGRIRLITSEIRLENFIKDAVEEVTLDTKHSHHICVSTNRLGLLVTDEKLLRNVVINLLNNAIKFSPGREEISLNVLDCNDVVTIEVRDEGIGILENEIETIFEPFFRGSAAGAIEGTGLGLSIVKKAVELLNGNIHVQSTPGRGSVFTVTIPRQEFHS